MWNGESRLAAAAARVLGAGVVACLVAGGSPAPAQEAPDFSNLSLEDLGRIDLVHAASRHAQTRGEAPSSVSVVTSEEIRRHGYRSVADVLRAMGSFYVTNDRNYSYVGVRGFGRPGDYNTRILILMDGIRTNEPIYDGTYVGREFVLDPAVIDRIEIIRGPGATMYGNSAFFAVINVVTKQGRQLRGGEVSASAGSFRDVGGQLTWGTVTPGGIDVLVSVSASNVRGRNAVEGVRRGDGFIQDAERANDFRIGVGQKRIVDADAGGEMAQDLG
jgi:iron complex outermembrane receptor protein